MPGGVSRLHAIVVASAFLLALPASYPARAVPVPSVEVLKVQYEINCELARIFDADRAQKKLNRYIAFQDEFWNIHPFSSAVEAAYHANAYEASLIAYEEARSKCLESKRTFLQALAEQIMLAALSEPLPEPTAQPTTQPTTRTTRRPPVTTTRRPPIRTTRTPPSGYQRAEQSAAAAAGLIAIIGGVIATSRPSRGPTVRPGGHRHDRYIP